MNTATITTEQYCSLGTVQEVAMCCFNITCVLMQLVAVIDIKCVRIKETKLFLVISSTKLGWFLWNLVHAFLNKFAAKSCKRFPPHLINVSTLPCETWNSYCTCATTKLLKKETPGIYLIVTVASEFTRFESSWLQNVGILQKKVYKTRITYLDEPKLQLITKRAKLDHIIAAVIRQWHRQ